MTVDGVQGERAIILKSRDELNADHIFDCGQCFRWNREEDGSYTGIVSSYEKAEGDKERHFNPVHRIANISCDREEIRITVPATEKVHEEPRERGSGVKEAFEKEKGFWQDYLDLEQNYSRIKRVLGERDPVVKQAIAAGKGIRILHQDPWETVVSFIISSNNNIPRIQKNIEDLAEKFGEPAGRFRGRMFYGLPRPGVLARLTEKDLAPCRLGYRAGYLIKTAAMVEKNGGVTEGDLLSYHGVGPKVAGCISLFAMKKYDSFPIDTWVAKVMKELYGIADRKAMASFAEKTFGEYRGIAQQYLFYYMRYHGS